MTTRGMLLGLATLILFGVGILAGGALDSRAQEVTQTTASTVPSGSTSTATESTASTGTNTTGSTTGNQPSAQDNKDVAILVLVAGTLLMLVLFFYTGWAENKYYGVAGDVLAQTGSCRARSWSYRSGPAANKSSTHQRS